MSDQTTVGDALRITFDAHTVEKALVRLHREHLSAKAKLEDDDLWLRAAAMLEQLRDLLHRNATVVNWTEELKDVFVDIHAI